MAMVTKWAMATDCDNTGNGNGKEGGRQAKAATMAMGMGAEQRTEPLALLLERGGDGGNGPWFVGIYFKVRKDNISSLVAEYPNRGFMR